MCRSSRRQRRAGGEQAKERGHAHVEVERDRDVGAELLGEEVEHFAHVDRRGAFILVLVEILVLIVDDRLVGDALQVFGEEKHRRAQQRRLYRRNLGWRRRRRDVVHDGAH